MKKVELTLKQMVEAVNVNVDNPWEVVGIGRSSWFRSLRKNGTTMKELRSQSQSQSQCTEVSAHIHPVPQNVATEANTVGRGGVRYRFTDTEKYNEFVKEDAFRIMERAIKNEITHKPAEREIKPEIPEELLQYDQIDVPYDVWTKYIDESKGEHWGTFVMRYGRFLEPKEHKHVDETPAEPRKVYPKGFLF